MQNLLIDLKNHFALALNKELDIMNKENQSLSLEKIKSFEIGYSDMAQGSRNYPAFFVYNSGRSLDGYYTNEHIVIRLVISGENASTLENYGYLYMDALERTIRKDKSLGGAVLYPIDGNITSVIFGITYVINLEFDVVQDRGKWENADE